jgi:hypothetical protein
MKPWRFFIPILFFPLVPVFFPPDCQAQLSASITLNAGLTVASFTPVNVFGINTASWRATAEHKGAKDKVQAAGNCFLRYPAGSADDVHWNGEGTFNANGYWTPDDTKYKPGFNDGVKFLGTSTSYGLASHLSDGNDATTWMSNVDTDFPQAQWAYLDLGTARPVDAVTIHWGNPYATRFTLQYWDPAASNQWAPYSDFSSHWLNTSAVSVTGPGGAQGVAFTPVNTRFIRVLMTGASGSVTAHLGSVTLIGPAYAIAEIYACQGSTQLSVNTPGSSKQTQAVVSSTDPACTRSWSPDMDFESFMELARSFSPRVPPLISVNMGTGTPQEAAAWVHYANIVKGYGIKYWQIGNEMEGSWEWGGPLNTRDYVRRYVRFYEAMKAVDPSIVITGPVSGNPYSASVLYDGKGVVEDFIYLLDEQGKAAYVDALDFHWFPTWQPMPEGSVLSSPSQIQGIASSLSKWISGTKVNPDVPVFMSEYNLGASGNLPMLNQWVNGLWLADTLGQFIRSFGSRGFTNFFAIIAGGSDTTDKTQGDLGYLQAESGPYQYQERATYWAYRMVAAEWAIAGDSGAHQLVAADSSNPLLTAYADARPDHVLSLLVINKDPANAFETTLSFQGFSPRPSATGLTFDPSHYAWDTSTTPYHANPDTPPGPVSLTGVSRSFPVTFKPYSLTVLRFTGSNKSR